MGIGCLLAVTYGFYTAAFSSALARCKSDVQRQCQKTGRSLVGELGSVFYVWVWQARCRTAKETSSHTLLLWRGNLLPLECAALAKTACVADILGLLCSPARASSLATGQCSTSGLH